MNEYKIKLNKGARKIQIFNSLPREFGNHETDTDNLEIVLKSGSEVNVAALQYWLDENFPRQVEYIEKIK